MKLSVSLSEDDVAVLDTFVRRNGMSSRSAAVQHAIQLLRLPDLEADYAAAWQEWETTGERAAWEGVIADGVTDAAR